MGTLVRTVSAALSPGVAAAMKQLRDELGLAVRHKLALRKARRYQGAKGLKVNFGCGAAVKNDWVNVDLNKAADLALDLRLTLPFDTASCGTVYTEHFLEHLAYPGEAFAFLRECRRVLEPGGVISIGVPDTEWYMLDYCGAENQSRKNAGFADEDVFAMAKRLWHPPWVKTRMEHLHYHARQGNQHQFAYDFESLEHALRTAGFADIKRRAFDPALDSRERALNTLYVEARRPE